jgi:hypothetical protein
VKAWNPTVVPRTPTPLRVIRQRIYGLIMGYEDLNDLYLSFSPLEVATFGGEEEKIRRFKRSIPQFLPPATSAIYIIGCRVVRHWGKHGQR